MVVVWGLVVAVEVVVAVALQWELHGEVEGSFTVTPSLLHSKCSPLYSVTVSADVHINYPRGKNVAHIPTNAQFLVQRFGT